MKLCIADPPYLGRAVRWYGAGGCGNGRGGGQADNHPEAYLWDMPETHINLVKELQDNYDGWAIAMTVHSLSTYMQAVETNSRNGIRVLSWIKPGSVPSGNRILNTWEPVLIQVPTSRKNYKSGKSMRDVLEAAPLRSNFIGAKPEAWTHWVLDALGYQNGDEVTDMFGGSGAVQNAINSYCDTPSEQDLCLW
tara:strand:- start:18 stop:596 length:579 start_codon:yes stop_codon:yes gene_type:complete